MTASFPNVKGFHKVITVQMSVMLWPISQSWKSGHWSRSSLERLLWEWKTISSVSIYTVPASIEMWNEDPPSNSGQETKGFDESKSTCELIPTPPEINAINETLQVLWKRVLEGIVCVTIEPNLVMTGIIDPTSFLQEQRTTIPNVLIIVVIIVHLNPRASPEEPADT